MEQDFQSSASVKDYVLQDEKLLWTGKPVKPIKLLPGETDGVQWADFETVHSLIAEKKICKIIARQFLKQEADLKLRQE